MKDIYFIHIFICLLVLWIINLFYNYKETFIMNNNISMINCNIAHRRIIVIGDIHGNLEGLVRILNINCLLNKNGNWIQNVNTVLIQVGDVVDRGPYSLECLQLLKKLQSQAYPGQIIRLLGNHEIMLLENDFRFINQHTDTPEKRIKMQNIIKNDILTNKLLPSFAYNNILFCHAGVTRNFIKHFNVKNANARSISDIINKMVFNILSENNYLNDNQCFTHDHPLLGNDGPFWVRTSDVYDEYPFDKFIQIIGHTPKDSVSTSPRNGAIYTDVGITQNELGFLEIINNNFFSYKIDKGRLIKKKLI